MIKKIFFIIFLLISSILFVGFFSKPKDVLVKEDTEYIYYKQYSIFGYNYSINKFHKPITYDGKVIKKNRNSHWMGCPGKGGRMVTDYTLVIEFNGKTHKFDEKYSMSIYNSCNKGDNVKVTEYFYPKYKVEFTK